jgi:hypothetical protein
MKIEVNYRDEFFLFLIRMEERLKLISDTIEANYQREKRSA